MHPFSNNKSSLNQRLCFLSGGRYCRGREVRWETDEKEDVQVVETTDTKLEREHLNQAQTDKTAEKKMQTTSCSDMMPGTSA